MSVGPSVVLNIGLSFFEYLTNRTRCFRNLMCHGPGLLLYLESTFNAYIIVTIVCTIPYISCPTTLLYGYFLHSLPCEMNPTLCNRVSSSNVAPTDPLAETRRRMISNKLLLSYRQSITVT